MDTEPCQPTDHRRPQSVSTTDPDATWVAKGGRHAALAYYDDYLIDPASRVILGVEATPARFRHEALAARRLITQVARLGIRPDRVSADKAYGSGEFLAWLLDRGIHPHIPVIDRRRQTRGRFTQEDFRYVPEEDAYYCPAGTPLRLRGVSRDSHVLAYYGRPALCRACPLKTRCTSGPARTLSVHRYEPARQTVRALAGTPAYARSRRNRQLIEGLFAELKEQLHLRRVRLRRLWNVAEQFRLAATAQNLKRLVRFLAQRPPVTAPSTA